MPGDEAAAADAAAARARRSAVAASEAAAAAKRASSVGSGADGAYASSFERTSRAPSPRRPGSRPESPAGSVSGTSPRRGVGAAAGWEPPRQRGHSGGHFSDGFSDAGRRSRETFARAAFASRDDFSFPDPDGPLPSPPRRDRPSRPRAFSASRSALDAEMENATALLDALREGRVAPSLDGSDGRDSRRSGSRSRSGSPARRRDFRDSQSLYASGDEGSFRSYQYQYE